MNHFPKSHLVRNAPILFQSNLVKNDCYQKLSIDYTLRFVLIKIIAEIQVRSSSLHISSYG